MEFRNLSGGTNQGEVVVGGGRTTHPEGSWHGGVGRGRYSHCGLVELRRNAKLYIGINLVSSVYSCARLIIWFIASPVDRFSGVGRARLRGGPELSIG